MIADVTNHLWQSTIFASVVGLITLAFRPNRAQVRYWLWLTASLKFLLPFSLLITLGSRLQWVPVTQKIAAAPAVTFTVMRMSQPFRTALPPVPSIRDSYDWATLGLCGLWACGFLGVVLMRFRGWRRVRAARRSSVLVDVLETMQVRSSPGLLEPGVVGLFQPILLLPAGLADCLQPAQLKAVLAHELTHARRHDNLTSAVHMIVETVFWFYPPVWWIGARLVVERERACDEAVLGQGNEPLDYAEGILTVCKSYLASPLSCVSGVTGSDLKQRIRAILTGRVVRDLTFVKRLTLTIAGITALILPISLGIISAPGVHAHSQSAAPRFEVASIRACEAFRKSAVKELSPERLSSGCTTVQRLIQQAYGLFDNGRMNVGSSLTVTGGPAWTRSDFYQINAKAEGPQSRAMMNGPMLQTLLEDRFKLQVHRETREVPVYALTETKGGAKVQPFQQGSCIPFDADHPPQLKPGALPRVCGMSQVTDNGLDAFGVTMTDFAASFSAILDRPVINETGIAGKFNIHLSVSPHELGVDRPRALPAVSDPTVSPTTPEPADIDTPDAYIAVQDALKKLGLNLKPAKGPGEFLVIDHVERPSAN